jgi:hypothetical protein
MKKQTVNTIIGLLVLIVGVITSVVAFMPRTSAKVPTQVSAELELRMEKTINELVDSFTISMKQPLPKPGDLFPKTPLTSIEKKSVSFEGKISVLLMGSGESESCSSAITFIRSNKGMDGVQIVRYVTGGQLKVTTETGVTWVDARLPDDQNGGKLRSLIGLVQEPAAFLLDKSGVVRWQALAGGFTPDLVVAISNLQSGRDLVSDAAPLVNGERILDRMKPENGYLAKEIADKQFIAAIQAPKSLLIFTQNDCLQCSNLTQRYEKYLEGLDTKGVLVGIIDKGASSSTTSTFPTIYDPRGLLFKRMQIGIYPTFVFLKEGKYVGTLPYMKTILNLESGQEEIELSGLAIERVLASY